MSTLSNLNCPFCNKEMRPTDVFCPTCGKKVPDKDIPFSSAKKIKIYLISVILAPLGLYWFFKYFKNSDPEKRKVAFVTLFLTLITTVVISVISYYYIKQLNSFIGVYDFSSLGL